MPPPTEAEIIAARLTRMKFLIDALEAQFSTNAQHQETFLKLKQELDATRIALKPIDTQQRS
jgi:hypothetical protein